jgi:hypothetical protein
MQKQGAKQEVADKLISIIRNSEEAAAKREQEEKVDGEGGNQNRREISGSESRGDGAMKSQVSNVS